MGILFVMPETSPWFSIYNFAPPHFPFCGVLTDHWNADPVDTYTSVFYTMASVILYFMAKKSNSPKAIKNIALIPLLVTFGSVIFHMSFTFVFLVLDFLGIFLLNFYGIGLNYMRLGKMKRKDVIRFSWACTILYAFMMAVVYKAHIHSGLLMVPILFVFFRSEYLCFKREEGVNYKPYLQATVLTLIGYVAFLLEGPPLRLGCEEPWVGKLQLHSIWHFFSAFSMIYVFRFYNQEKLRKSFIEEDDS